MQYIPISAREFKKLLKNGTVAELSVMDEINQGFMHQSDVGINCECWNATDEVPSDYHCDLVVRCWDIADGWCPFMNEAHYDIEVKSAENGGAYTDWNTGKNTYFAECVQTGTNGYPEYLVTPPDFMVYVDTKDLEHHWYDGKKFAQAVKDRFHRKFPIDRGTAEGIKFTVDSVEFGYIGSFKPSKSLADIKKHYAERLRERAAAPKKKTKIHKQCDGLEDLK